MMFDNLVEQLNSILASKLAPHIRWRILITKDTLYVGKVLKIIAQNVTKTRDDFDNELIDLRYSSEQAIVCIPLQNHSTVEEFSDYLNTQIDLAIQSINKALS